MNHLSRCHQIKFPQIIHKTGRWLKTAFRAELSQRLFLSVLIIYSVLQRIRQRTSAFPTFTDQEFRVMMLNRLNNKRKYSSFGVEEKAERVYNDLLEGV